MAKMRNPPQTVTRGILWSLKGVSARCSTFCSNKNFLLYSVRSRSSISAFGARIVEKSNLGLSRGRNLEKMRSWGEVEEPNSSCLEVSVNGGVRRGQSSGGDLVCVNGKNRLKWYSEMLRDCTAARRCREGKVIHGCIIRSWTEPDVRLWVYLINFYAKCGALELSCCVFKKISMKDVVSWTALISGFVAQERVIESVELFCKMRRGDVRPNEFTLATVLKGCSMSLYLDFGKQVQAEVVKIGFLSDVYVGSSLIDLYSKCGEMEYADHVFCIMPEKNDFLWNALLNGYAQGNGEAVLSLFSKMTEPEMRFSNHTLSIVLKGIASSLTLRAGQTIHSIAVKIGGELDDFVTCGLVNVYSKCGVAEDALKVFEKINNPDTVTWSTTISVLDHHGLKEEAAKTFLLMRHSGIRPDQFTLSSLASAATDMGYLRYGQSIHACAYKFGFDSFDSLSNALISMYMKLGSLSDGYHIFKSNRDVITRNALLSGFQDDKTSDEGTRVFKDMLMDGFRPNMCTYISTLRSCSSLSNMEFGKQVHAHILKDKFDNDGHVGTALLDMYAKCGSMEDAEAVFNRLNEKDVFTWTALISGFSQTNQGEKAAHCFNKMRREGVIPDEITIASCVGDCSGIASLEFGRQLHSFAIQAGLSTEMLVSTSLVGMYAKCGSMEYVEAVFNRLNEKDVVTWTALISGYSQTNQGEKAAHCFNKMRREGVIPDGFTISSCLRGCSAIASLENGRQLHALAIQAGLSTEMLVSTSLVDMYGKCGCIDDAEILFSDVKSRDTVTWSTMICGYSQHGEGDKALQAYGKMINDGLVPDGITFLGILSSCSHMGLVEEGKKYFHSMSDTYRITPSIEHYACLVDMLGRAGKFDEVEILIQQMEPAPNASIWKSILGACRIYGNVELGEKAAEKLLQMDPDTSSNYILLSNLYASRERWDDASKVRASMSRKGIKKKPGCSWFEVDAQVHVFLSQDASHPRISEIHHKLKELGHKVTEAWYAPNPKYALHDVSDKEKIDNLSNHSERLALAFALINKPTSGKIRIFKNIRICGDCHEYMKFVSGTIDQEIIIRDTSRFHHFHNGLCSCKDYW